MKINIGITDTDREIVSQSLKGLLADSYTLYLQTHNFHWNVTGPRFHDLHNMFESQYTELSTAVDEIAERIRTLGVVAPGTYQQFTELTDLHIVESVPTAEDMLSILTKNHEKVVQRCRQVLLPAEKAQDESTLNLVSDRMLVHEKTAWMLRSML